MNYRTFSLLLLYILAPSLSFAQQEFFPFVAEISSDRAHIRAGQSENFESLVILSKADQVIVVLKEYSWYKILLPKSAESYISDKYVAIQSEDKGMITGDRVNIRAGAGINFSIIGQVEQGKEIRILGRKEGWYQMEPLDDSYGWVHESLLTYHGKYYPEKKPPLYSPLGMGKEKEETAQAAPSFDGMRVSFVGQLRQVEQEDPLYGDFRYQLTETASPISYYIDGPEKILHEFEQETVKLEGNIFSHTAPSPHTTIKLIKIERQL